MPARAGGEAEGRRPYGMAHCAALYPVGRPAPRSDVPRSSSASPRCTTLLAPAPLKRHDPPHRVPRLALRRAELKAAPALAPRLRRSHRDVPRVGSLRRNAPHVALRVLIFQLKAHVHRVLFVPIARHRAADPDRVRFLRRVAHVDRRPQFARAQQRVPPHKTPPVPPPPWPRALRSGARSPTARPSRSTSASARSPGRVRLSHARRISTGIAHMSHSGAVGAV